MNRLREQIARVLETDKKKMTRIWREMLQSQLVESERMIRKVLSNNITAVYDKERWPANLGCLARHNRPYKG